MPATRRTSRSPRARRRRPSSPTPLRRAGAGRDAGRAHDRGGVEPARASTRATLLKSRAGGEARTARSCLALVRGDHRVNPIKLAERARRGDPAGDRGRDPRHVRRASRASSGRSACPSTWWRTPASSLASTSTGANEAGKHLRGVEPGRDFEARFADIRTVEAGDTLPARRHDPRSSRRSRSGNIFKLGTRYSEALGATLPGRARPGAARS